MTETINAKIYRINDIHFTTSDPESVIEERIRDYNRGKEQSLKFKELQLREDIQTKGLSLKLFYKQSKNTPPDWLEFVKELTDSPDEINFNKRNASFILFIYKNNELFAVTKGHTGTVITNLLDDMFGLNILSRLVKLTQTEIRQIEERSVFGTELGASRNFRGDHRLMYENSFGKIYKSLLAKIDSADFGKLNIVTKRSNTTSLSITGGAALHISTVFDINELVGRILKIIELLKEDAPSFNQFKIVQRNVLTKIKDSLEDILIQEAYNSLQANDDFDFVHPKSHEYWCAEEVSFNGMIIYEGTPTFLTAINLLVDENIIDITSIDNFKKGLKETEGGFRYSNDEEFSDFIKLEDWLSGEITFGPKQYFKLDGNWYLFEANFNESLNERLSIINHAELVRTQTLVDWDNNIFATEGEYNSHFLHEDRFIVCDTALINNLEVCDLIKIEDGALNLYHVKQKLGRDMRVVVSQIYNSALFLMFARKNGENENLDAYFQKICSKQYGGNDIQYTINGQPRTLNQQQFIDMIRNNDLPINFILAYTSTSNRPVQEEFQRSKSRIAKLSLLFCIDSFRGMEFNFHIERIPII